MRRWASIAGRHGLLLLEVHSLKVADTARYMAEATSLHFDALQSWSGQLLVPAAHWQLALAHAGLQIAREVDQAERLEPLYASIRERVSHLTEFLKSADLQAVTMKVVKKELAEKAEKKAEEAKEEAKGDGAKAKKGGEGEKGEGEGSGLVLCGGACVEASGEGGVGGPAQDGRAGGEQQGLQQM